MMQHGWRGGPQMRGGGMFGRGGGFNQGFRGGGGGGGGVPGGRGGGGAPGGRGGGGGGRGGGGRPRRDRSRSPVRGSSTSLGEPADWEMRTDVILDFFNSDLNLNIDPTGLSAKPIHTEGFAYMWAGARSTYGVKPPPNKDGGYSTHVCYEVRVGEKLPVPHLPPDESNPHVIRVGWSTDDTSFALGEEPRSWGYGGTGKKSFNCKFESYGTTFSTGDIVTAFLEFEPNGGISMSYSINGRSYGEAFRTNTRELGERALFPHVYAKNLPFEINFGQQETPWSPLPESQPWTFIGNIPVEKRVRGLCPPEKIEDCSILMMCGLPGAGKTFWADKHAQSVAEKRFTVLGTNNILDKMKVMGLPRKRNYSGRWDVLIELSTKCLNKLFEIASRRKRNYILDQTNVYPNAQRRKMRPFESFHRKAVVVVPTDEEFQRRINQRTKEEGKEVPESAVLEMKANFKIPDENDLFEEILFTELDRPATETLVRQYNEEAQRWKRGGSSAAPPGSDVASQDSSGAKFKPDRNYGRSSTAATSARDELSSVSSFGRGSRDFNNRGDSERNMRGGRGDWRGGRGGFRGGFNSDRGNEKPDAGFRGFAGSRTDRDSGSQNDHEESREDRIDRPGGFQEKEFERGPRGFDNRRGGFQRDDSDRRRFGDRGESFTGGRDAQGQGGFPVNPPGFLAADQSAPNKDEFGSDRRGFQADRSTGFHDRNRGGFSGDRGREPPVAQVSADRNTGPGGPDHERGGFYEGFNTEKDDGFGDRNFPGGRQRGGFSGRGRGGFGSDRGGGFGGDRSGGFGSDRGGGFGGDRGSGGFGGDRGGGFNSDRGGGFGSDRSGGFGNDRSSAYGSDRGGGFGSERSGGFTSDRGEGFGNDRGGGFGGDQRGGFGGDRGGGFGGDRSGGFGGDRGGGFAGDRGGGFGGDRAGGNFTPEQSAGFGQTQASGFEGERGGGTFGSRGGGRFNDRGGGNFRDRSGFNERGSGFSDRGGSRFSSDRGGRFGNDRGGRGFGGNRGGSPGFSGERGDRIQPSNFGSGGFSDRGNTGSSAYGGDRGRSDRGGNFGSRGGFNTEGSNFYGERTSGGFDDTPEISSDPATGGRNRPKTSRWSDAQPTDPSSQLNVAEPHDDSAMNRSGTASQYSKSASGYGDYGGRSSQMGEAPSYSYGNRQSDTYGSRQPPVPGPRSNFSNQPGQTDNVAYAEQQQSSGYDASRHTYQDFSSYQAQPSSSSQQETTGYNYGQEAAGGYGPYSQPPPQLPQTDVSNYQQQNYGGQSSNYNWTQPPTDQQQPQQQSSWVNTQPPQSQPNWQQWQQPPPSTSQPQHTGPPNETWPYYQQPPPHHDWQQQPGY